MAPLEGPLHLLPITVYLLVNVKYRIHVERKNVDRHEPSDDGQPFNVSLRPVHFSEIDTPFLTEHRYSQQPSPPPTEGAFLLWKSSSSSVWGT